MIKQYLYLLSVIVDRMSNEKYHQMSSFALSVPTQDQQTKPKFAFKMNLRPPSRNSSLSSIASCASSSNDPVNRPDGLSFKSGTISNRRVSQLQRELDLAMDAYRLKRKYGVVDVWWLNDDGDLINRCTKVKCYSAMPLGCTTLGRKDIGTRDSKTLRQWDAGGLTLLLAHLITSKRSYLGGATMRLFTFASDKEKIPEEKQGLQNLLEKFRIKCSEINVIGDETPPHPWTVGDFERTVNMFKRSPNDTDYIANPAYYVTDNQLDLLRYKTSIYLKTRDLVAEMSKNSDLIIITMPIPRRGREGACLYFTWLEMLTRGLSTSPDTPVMLIRGNQEDVLTFYS
uniref:SLC12A transporter C-terminal domain-containing protein n=1 Tax=Romanomermis culicivorax TaxID=13658 RepID=A0A915HV23_ROMCU